MGSLAADCLLLVLAAGASTAETAPAPARPECLEAITVRRDASVMEEQRRKGRGWDDFPGRYAAAAIDPTKHRPVEAVQGHRVHGRPILWFTPDGSAAVVDRGVLSDVTIADVTRLGPDDPPITVTRLAGEARAGHPPRAWLLWLIASGAIQTFAHLEAALCVESEQEGKDGYEAIVSGRHVYYTSRRNEAPYRFAFRLAPSGVVTVAGLPAR
jgi:hypothetical protein